MDELSSISAFELAREGYQLGEGRRLLNEEEFTRNQEFFCWQVAQTNDLKLLRWVREEKECDWTNRTSHMWQHSMKILRC